MARWSQWKVVGKGVCELKRWWVQIGVGAGWEHQRTGTRRDEEQIWWDWESKEESVCEAVKTRNPGWSGSQCIFTEFLAIFQLLRIQGCAKQADSPLGTHSWEPTYWSLDFSRGAPSRVEESSGPGMWGARRGLERQTGWISGDLIGVWTLSWGQRRTVRWF